VIIELLIVMLTAIAFMLGYAAGTFSAAQVVAKHSQSFRRPEIKKARISPSPVLQIANCNTTYRRPD
jgi:cytochrome c-type biogenesis protein CcmE